MCGNRRKIGKYGKEYLAQRRQKDITRKRRLSENSEDASLRNRSNKKVINWERRKEVPVDTRRKGSRSNETTSKSDTLKKYEEYQISNHTSPVVQDDNNSDNDSELIHLSKQELVHIILTLKEENRKIKKEAGVTLQSAYIYNDLRNIKQLSAQIVKNLEIANQKTSEIGRKKHIDDFLNINLENSSSATSKVDQAHLNLFENSEFSCAHEDNSTKEEIEFTISAEKLKKCRFLNSSALTHDLLNIIFTREEFRTSSLTGSIPNLHKSKTNVEPTLQLDPKRVQFVYEFVKDKFPNEDNIELTVKKIIQQKCNNAKPRPGRKKENE